MWSLVDRGRPVILSWTVWRLAPETSVTLPVKLAMSRLPRAPWDTQSRRLVDVEPGSKARPVMVRVKGPKGVNTCGEPPSVPLALIV